MSEPWKDVREQLVEDLGELFAQRFDALPDDYKPSFIDVLAFLRGDTLAPEMTAMSVAESRMERDALQAKLSKMERIRTFVVDSAEFDDEGNSINDAGKLLDEIYGPDWDDLVEEMDEEMDAALAGGEDE